MIMKNLFEVSGANYDKLSKFVESICKNIIEIKKPLTNRRRMHCSGLLTMLIPSREYLIKV